MLEDTLAQFIGSLAAVNAASGLLTVPLTQPAFSHYEQVVTLKEVLGSLKHRDIAAELSSVLDEKSDEVTRKANASRAIDFFYALENRALDGYSRQADTRDK
jgi:hypothetical protein